MHTSLSLSGTFIKHNNNIIMHNIQLSNYFFKISNRFICYFTFSFCSMIAKSLAVNTCLTSLDFTKSVRWPSILAFIPCRVYNSSSLVGRYFGSSLRHFWIIGSKELSPVACNSLCAFWKYSSRRFTSEFLFFKDRSGRRFRKTWYVSVVKTESHLKTMPIRMILSTENIELLIVLYTCTWNPFHNFLHQLAFDYAADCTKPFGLIKQETAKWVNPLSCSIQVTWLLAWMYKKT